MKKGRKKKNSLVSWVLALLLAAAFLFLFFKYKEDRIAKPVAVTSPQPHTEAESPRVTSAPITDPNFSGTRITISGSSVLAALGGRYIDDTIADFKVSADQEVPAMRAKFGADSPLAHYSIDFTGRYTSGDKTESVILTQYVYTGGASGTTLYKVFTKLKANASISPLSALIKTENQAKFTAFVKKALKAWRPEGSDGPVVFPEDVDRLTFSSFDNWSLNNKNLIIYFDQGSIAPGAVGAVAFPIPLSSIKDIVAITS